MPARTASNPSLPEPRPPRPTRRLPYLLAPLLLLLSLCAQAATYHVVPTGDDADPGDAASPWASIGHAADQVAPGDTVVVAAGTYPELVTVTASGTAAAPIRFEAAGAVTVEGFRLLGDDVQVAGFKVRTLDCGDGDSYGIESRGAGFVIEGNDIYEMPDGGIHTAATSSGGVIRNNRLARNVQSGIELHGAGHLVEGNEIVHPLERHPEAACNNGGDDANGITFFGTDHVLRGNLIHDITYADPDVLDAHADCFQTYGSWIGGEVNRDILIEDNVCEALTYQNADENGNGLYIQDVTRLTIRNNVFLTYGGLGASEDVYDLIIANNTFVSALDLGGSAELHRGIDLWHETVVGGAIRNNIFVNFRGGPYYIGSRVTSTAHDHNLAYWTDGSNPVESWWAFGCTENGNLCADPQLADPAALDFRIAAGSPALDAGSSDVPVTDDIDGLPRPQGAAFDLGAHELAAEPVAPWAVIAAAPTTGEAPLTVQFEDRSGGGPSAWRWDFGDGAGSTAQNPAHTYDLPGGYTVSLTVGNAEGSDTGTWEHLIQVAEPSLDEALFSDGFEAGLSHWQTSDLAERYNGTPKVGAYAAQLRRRGAVAASIPTTGYTDIQVAFQLGAKSLDKGTEYVIAEWYDGSAWRELTRITDGEEDGQLHAHSFALPTAAEHSATFSLRFVLHGSGRRDYAWVDEVVVTGIPGAPPTLPPVADFSTDVSAGNAPLTVQFTDASTDATDWSWRFGDGATSTVQSPSHTYTAAGTYDVTLTASNAQGSDGVTRTGLITVTDPVVALDTYHVATTGDDANPGTEAAPLRTIQAALDLAQPGATVMVQSGTYNELVTFPRSGTADAWITLQAQPGHAVTLDGAGLTIADYWEGVVTIADVSHVRVQGLRVAHSGYTGIIANRASFVEIRGNQTYDTYLSGIGVWRSDNVIVDGNQVALAVNGGEQECITVSISSQVEVTNNEVSNDGAGTAGGEGIDIKDGSSNVLVKGNHVHDLDELGIYVDSWDSDTADIVIEDNIVHHCNNHGIALAAERGGRLDRITIRNNLTYANARMGITVGDWDDGWPHPMQNILIVNNTSVGNGPHATWGAGIAVLNGEAQGVVIRNNVVADNVYAQILDESAYSGTAADITADHNLVWGPTGSGDEFAGTDRIAADPRFVDAASADYRLAWDSPAVDAGTSLDAPATDLDGNARPAGAGFDLGAYEYQAGPVPPAAGFSADPLSGAAPLSAQFTDTSAHDPATWLWSFGDGTTSTEQHPLVTYTEPGLYDVTLTVTNDQGSDSLTRSGLVSVQAPDTSVQLFADDFEADLTWLTSGDAALHTGTPNNDGTALQVLKHGSAEAAVSTQGFGTLGLSFAMGAKSLDNSGEAVLLEWWDGAQWQVAARIADGTTHENGRLNPYEIALPAAAEDNADFALRMRIAGSGRRDFGWLDDVELRGEPLGPPTAPIAGFDAAPLTGPAPTQVAFADTSANRPTGWLWSFGDGTTSTERNPVHDYTTPGSYGVALTVTNAAGSDTLALPGLVTITEPPADVTIFMDDFSGGLGGWYTERDIAVVDGVATLTGNNVWMSRGISTAGYDSIRVSVRMGAESFEAWESLILYWQSGGSTRLVSINDGDPEEDGLLHSLSFDLPPEAADNPDFGLAVGQWDADSGDFGYIDDIRVSGKPR